MCVCVFSAFWFVKIFVCVGVCVCLAVCLCIVLCMVMYMWGLNDHGLSEVCLPKRPVLFIGKALWRSSSVFHSLCLSLSQAGRTQTEVLPSWGTNPHFLWNFQRRFFPVQIPQPLNFPGRNSENNSEERRMEEEGEGTPPSFTPFSPLLSPLLWISQICAPADYLK